MLLGSVFLTHIKMKIAKINKSINIYIKMFASCIFYRLSFSVEKIMEFVNQHLIIKDVYFISHFSIVDSAMHVFIFWEMHFYQYEYLWKESSHSVRTTAMRLIFIIFENRVTFIDQMWKTKLINFLLRQMLVWESQTHFYIPYLWT